MGNAFYYSSTTTLNGILKSFYNKDSEYYQNFIETFASSSETNYDYKDAFKFDNEKYWVANPDQEGEIFISFCLKNYFSKIEGFEIQTSNGLNLPQNFSFSSSLNKEDKYYNYVNYSHAFSKEDSLYFSYHSSISKCFKLTCIKSTNIVPVFDVRHIDIYGEIHPNIRHFLHITCVQKKICIVFIIYIFILTIK